MIHHCHGWCRSAILFLWMFFACLGASAQDASDQAALGIPPPLLVAALPTAPYKFDLSFKLDSLEYVNFADRGIVLATTPLTPGLDGMCRLTLEEAQQAVGGAGNPLVRLAQLSVEVAKQHRQGVQGLYYPNIGTQLANLHLNKQTGQVLTVQHPLTGMIVSVPVNIFAKNQTDFNVGVAQPVTPLLSIYQLVKIARADENIAKSKAGMPVAETARNVEKNFFDLLVAQRELTSAEADTKKIQSKWLTASNSGSPIVSTAQGTDLKGVVLGTSKVKELTVSLNGMVGLPEGTRLELVPPEPLAENVTCSSPRNPSKNCRIMLAWTV